MRCKHCLLGISTTDKDFTERNRSMINMLIICGYIDYDQYKNARAMQGYKNMNFLLKYGFIAR